MAATARRRLAANYKPKIIRALAPLISQDATAIRAALNEFTSVAAFIGWLEGYLGERQSPARKAVQGIFQSLAKDTAKMAGEEIETEINPDRPVKFAAGFSRKFGEIYTASSVRQLSAVAQQAELEQQDPVESIDARLTEWSEGGQGAPRSEKMARRQSVKLSNVISRLVFFSAGYGLVWVTFGKNCPFCDSLDGKRVGGGQEFVPSGDYKPGGADHPIRLRAPALEPPIHSGCDCSVAPG